MVSQDYKNSVAGMSYIYGLQFETEDGWRVFFSFDGVSIKSVREGFLYPIEMGDALKLKERLTTQL